MDRLTGRIFIINELVCSGWTNKFFRHYTYKMDYVTVIDHRGGMLSLSDCLFRKTSPHAELYKGDRSHVVSHQTILDGFEDENI